MWVPQNANYHVIFVETEFCNFKRKIHPPIFAAFKEITKVQKLINKSDR